MGTVVAFEGLETRALFAEISGVIFNDMNADGVRDAGETGIGNAAVFLDANFNSSWDDGEVSATCDSNGGYRFEGLAPGSYRVVHLPQEGWQRTTGGAGMLYLLRNSSSGTGIANISAFDPVSGTTIRSFDSPSYSSLQIPRLAAGSDSLFMMLSYAGTPTQTLYEMDLNTGTYQRVHPVNIGEVSDIAWMKGHIFMLAKATSALVEFDPATNSIVRTTSLPPEISGGLAADADRELLIVTASDGSNLYVIQPADGTVVQTIPVSGGVAISSLACNDGVVAFAVSGSSTLRRFDASSGTELESLALSNPKNYTTRAIAGDGSFGKRLDLEHVDDVAHEDLGDIQLSAVPQRPLIVDLPTLPSVSSIRVAGVKAGSVAVVNNPYLSFRDNPVTRQTAIADDPVLTFTPFTYSFFGSQIRALQQEPGKRQSLFSPLLVLSAGTPIVSLTPATDTGFSNADLITSNNRPTFKGSAGSDDVSIRLVLDGREVQQVAISNYAFTSTLNAPLADGMYYLNCTYTKTDGRYVQFPRSKVLVIDTVAPMLLESRFDPDTNTVTGRFSEMLDSSVVPTVRLLDAESAVDRTPAGASVVVNQGTVELRLPSDFVLEDGRYLLQVGTGVKDVAGNTTPASVAAFSSLACDGNADARVDTADFNLLAGHFGETTNLVTHGDFNRDGFADSKDFDFFVQQYGKSLPASPAQGEPQSVFGDISEDDGVLYDMDV